jgi:hypothetical protein
LAPAAHREAPRPAADTITEAREGARAMSAAR